MVYASGLSPSGCYYRNAISPEDLSKYESSPLLTDEEGRTFLARYSEAMAAEARGTVYLLIPPNVGIEEVEPGQPPSVWVANEYPTLQRNSEVKEIVRVDPATHVADAQPAWKSGDPITLPASNA
jgi:hypothetical protein